MFRLLYFAKLNKQQLFGGRSLLFGRVTPLIYVRSFINCRSCINLLHFLEEGSRAIWNLQTYHHAATIKCYEPAYLRAGPDYRAISGINWMFTIIMIIKLTYVTSFIVKLFILFGKWGAFSILFPGYD